MNIRAIVLLKVRGMSYRLMVMELHRLQEELSWRVFCGLFISRYTSASEIQLKIRSFEKNYLTSFIFEINLQKEDYIMHLKFEPHHLNMFTY